LRIASIFLASALSIGSAAASEFNELNIVHKSLNYTPISKSKLANTPDCTPLEPCDGTDHCCMVGTDNGFCCPKDTDCNLDDLTCVPKDDGQKSNPKDN
jgi:hypothetical protein